MPNTIFKGITFATAQDAISWMEAHLWPMKAIWVNERRRFAIGDACDLPGRADSWFELSRRELEAFVQEATDA